MQDLLVLRTCPNTSVEYGDNVWPVIDSGRPWCLSGSHCAMPSKTKQPWGHCASAWLPFFPYLVYRKIMTLNRYQKAKTLSRVSLLGEIKSRVLLPFAVRSPGTFWAPSEVCRTQGFSFPWVLPVYQHPLLGPVRWQAGTAGRWEEEALYPRLHLPWDLDNTRLGQWFRQSWKNVLG